MRRKLPFLLSVTTWMNQSRRDLTLHSIFAHKADKVPRMSRCIGRDRQTLGYRTEAGGQKPYASDRFLPAYLGGPPRNKWLWLVCASGLGRCRGNVSKSAYARKGCLFSRTARYLPRSLSPHLHNQDFQVRP
jgi:hypothetical protein